MWPFARKQPPEVDLDNATYMRWLRAQRPPWLWFLQQPELVQEQLAVIGEQYVADCIEKGASTLTPQQEEEDLARRLAAGVLDGIGQAAAPSQPAYTPPQSMGGVIAARDKKDAERKNDNPARLFGRAPEAE